MGRSSKGPILDESFLRRNIKQKTAPEGAFFVIVWDNNICYTSMQTTTCNSQKRKKDKKLFFIF